MSSRRPPDAGIADSEHAFTEQAPLAENCCACAILAASHLPLLAVSQADAERLQSVAPSVGGTGSGAMVVNSVSDNPISSRLVPASVTRRFRDCYEAGWPPSVEARGQPYTTTSNGPALPMAAKARVPREDLRRKYVLPRLVFGLRL
jgi:hypothetical protein